MKRLVLTLAALSALSVPVLGADDPIASRQSLMDANAAATAVYGGVSKGEIAYAPALGKSVIATLAATALTMGDYFPEGSLDPKRSEASPKIWEDMAGFIAQIEKFKTATAAAREASGKAGPADVEAFKAAVGPVLASCKSCHEGYKED